MRARNRREALERGLRFYFNGKDCPRHHGDKRYATTGRCATCSIKAEVKRRQKKRNHKAANGQRAATMIRYWRQKKMADAFAKWIASIPV